MVKRGEVGSEEKNETPRKDDTLQVIEKRLRIDEKLVERLLDFYREKNLLHVIDGASDPDLIFNTIHEVLSSINK